MHTIMKKGLTILAGCLAMAAIIAGAGCEGPTEQTGTETAGAELGQTAELSPVTRTETADPEPNRTAEPAPRKEPMEGQLNTTGPEGQEESNENPVADPKETKTTSDHTQRDVSGMIQIQGADAAGTSVAYHQTARTLEDILQDGQDPWRGAPAHIVMRAEQILGTTRCAYRGFARTLENREELLRLGHQIEDDEPLPSLKEMEAKAEELAESVRKEDAPYIRADMAALIEGGLSNIHRILTCYGDYRVSDYVLGSGPDQITIAFDFVGPKPFAGLRPRESYQLYKKGYEGGHYDDDPFLTEEEYDTETNRRISEAEQTFRDTLEGRETLLFLEPLAQTGAIVIEGWNAMQTWDVQAGTDGTLLAVQYGMAETHAEYSQTLERFEERVRTAAATDGQAENRLASIEDLHQYYQDIGAYGDITPYDGSDATFMPAMPPPVPTCAGSTAVGTDSDPGLVSDCNALLQGKGMLAGTATLNWSKDLAMTSWDGIRLGGNPHRIQYLLLTGEDLDGSIPAYLGELSELRRIDLDENDLTGTIPPQLGSLKKLTHLYLQDNGLTGGLPPELGSMTALRVLYPEDNDLTGEVPEEIGNLSSLTQLVLADNQFSGPLPDSLGNLSNLGHLRLRDNELSGQIPRTLSALDIEHLGLSGNSFTGCLPTGLDTGGTNDDLWRPELRALPSCGPVFGETEYTFTLAATETPGATVGTVSAAPYETGDTLSYTITSGNADAVFALDSSTGAITLARAPTGSDAGSHTLTVEAEDGYEQKAMVTVSISLTE